ncbi:carbohydrate ABC transporter permease [Humidisolicoccus flavus]|uniref:carbohydrate ABC transporter permease n=1 Tax=Humidisolicoccus flavus TaxID=3111414 RepID=UPI00324B1D6B
MAPTSLDTRQITAPGAPPSRPVRRSRIGGRIARIAVAIVLVIMAIGVLYPLFWMFSSAFKTSVEIFASPWALPQHLNFDSWVTAWEKGVIAYFANSVFVTVISLGLVLILGAAAAFALTKLSIPFAKTITFLVLGGLMVSPTMILVPLFQLLQLLNLYDTHAGLIVIYVAYWLPFTIFLIRAYMLTIPNDMTEAARIDGASTLQLFTKIILPLCKPVLVSAGLVYVLFAWNEFPFALVLINDPELKTLPVGLLDFKSALQTDWPVLFAGLAIAAIPMMLAFAIGQRHFVRGLAEGMGK